MKKHFLLSLFLILSLVVLSSCSGTSNNDKKTTDNKNDQAVVTEPADASEPDPTETPDDQYESEEKDNTDADSDEGTDEIQDYGICVNDYVDISIVSADSHSVTYTLTENKVIDIKEGYNGIQVGNDYIVEMVCDGEWRNVNSIIKNVKEAAVYEEPHAISTTATELTTTWDTVDILPDGHYRIIKEVTLTSGDKTFGAGLHMYYIEIEFDINTLD